MSSTSAKAKRKKKNKSDKKKQVGKDSKLIKLSTWPDPSLQKIKLVYEQDTKDDKELIEKIHELNRFEVSIEDFLSLNGDVSVYGWQHVMNFALYEKYNFLVPLLKENLDEQSFQSLVKEDTHGLKDFVYAYCTILTLIMRKTKPQDLALGLLSDFLNTFSESIEAEINQAIEDINADAITKGFSVYPKGRPPVTPAPTATPETPEPAPADSPDYTIRKNFKKLIETEKSVLILKNKYGWQETEQNGNCFFEAVLRGVYHNREKIADNFIRALLDKHTIDAENMFSVENINEFRNDLANFVLFGEDTSYIDYTSLLGDDDKVKIRNKKEHYNHLRKAREYNEAADLVLVQYYFDICINIFRWIHKDKKWIKLTDCDAVDKPIVYLVFTGTINDIDAHYDTLIPYVEK